MNASTVCALATVWPGGRAHINHMYFAWSAGFDVVWMSDPQSRHSRNLLANPSAAVTVYDSHQTWGRPDRGIQLFGTAGSGGGRGGAPSRTAPSGPFSSPHPLPAGADTPSPPRPTGAKSVLTGPLVRAAAGR